MLCRGDGNSCEEHKLESNESDERCNQQQACFDKSVSVQYPFTL